jgi:hypothetical protein
VRRQSADGTGQIVLLFRNGNFLGWDSAYESMRLRLSATGTRIVVRYAVCRGDDPFCCPSGRARRVPLERLQDHGECRAATDLRPPRHATVPRSDLSWIRRLRGIARFRGARCAIYSAHGRRPDPAAPRGNRQGRLDHRGRRRRG